MALDGAFLYLTAAELRETLLGARVDRISQPSREELVITFRFKGGSRRVLFSANPSSPRVHLTAIPLENPPAPPMFCMLLRKHLNAGKVIGIRQNGLDRVLSVEFETVNELGDLTQMTLVAEIMGRHSNLILVGADGRIVDAIRRVTDEISSVRLVLPGLPYTPPPAQDKCSLLDTEPGEVLRRFVLVKNTDASKALMGVLEGISPLLARELVFRALKGQDIPKENWSDFYKKRLSDELASLRERLLAAEEDRRCWTVTGAALKVRDFTLLPVSQYGSGVESREYASPSELLDTFYADRDRQSRMKQRSHDLLRLLVNATERISRKLALQRDELAACADRDQLRVRGDLLNANLYRMEKGDRSVTVENFYEEGAPSLTIELDPRLTPSQNAQKYYAEYRKAATAEDKLRKLMAASEQELKYLDSVFDAVSRTEGESELLEIREELAQQGYLRHTAARRASRFVKPQPPLRFRSSDGFSILCGRNNTQNDRLTLKTARGGDLWLHTKDIAGSHVIVQAEGRPIPDRTIEEAAIIAAFHSKARDSAKVGVDYTLAKNVKKPAGAAPGMVIFTDNRTAYVTPDEQLVQRLRIEEGR